MWTKRNAVILLLLLIVLAVVFWRACTSSVCRYRFPDYNPAYGPPDGTPENQIFHLSQDYPVTAPVETSHPWTNVSFQTEQEAYARAVLDYCLEGNIPIDFKVQDNPVRKWYHVPWLHSGENGREWRHGLTRERTSRSGELHPSYTGQAFNWAVGFYNAPGGTTIRKVWPDCGHGLPEPAQSVFPEGTVTFKLLFTSATAAQVPYMAGAFTWTANSGGAIGSGSRSDREMRLLQIDIAVKDRRSPVGWVFGTFAYNGLAAGATPWEKFKLVGLIWGNDPTVTNRIQDGNPVTNPSLTQTYINPDILGDPAAPVPEGKVYHLGLGGRLNGPVDNPISSCTSCHAKASVLKELTPEPIGNIGRMPRVFPSGDITAMSIPKFNDFFGNTPPGSGDIDYNCFVTGFTACTGPEPYTTFIKTDYSLQIAIGIENYYSELYQRAEQFTKEQNESTKR